MDGARYKKNTLSSHFRNIFRFVGVHNGKRFTPHSITYFLVGLINFAYLAYVMLFTDCNSTKVAHFMVLLYFYIGTLWTAVSKSDEVMKIADECALFVGLDDIRVRDFHRVVYEEILSTTPGKALRTVTALACLICSYTCVEPFLIAFARNKELEFPFSGTIKNEKLFIAIYLLQCSMMFITFSVCAIIFQTQMGIALDLMVKYKVLQFELSNLNSRMCDGENVYASRLYKTARDCVLAHQHILSIFDEFKEVCSHGFQFSYIGLLGATTLSRALISGDDPDLGTIPHIICELSYIGIFCYILDKLEVEHNKLRDAVYAAEWAHMPKQVVSILLLIMRRTEKTPHVMLYKGGGYANLETFYKLLNGTCAYLIFGSVLDHAI